MDGMEWDRMESVGIEWDGIGEDRIGQRKLY